MKKLNFTIILLMAFTIGAIGQNFYDINTINTIEITFEESNWDEILDQLYAAGDEERLIGSVSINGEILDSVGVRYKGNSTYNPFQVKNPLNIKLDHVIDDQTIEGYGTLKLANCYKDPSFIREVLSYEIARNYMPACQSNYANVYINGTHLGLYTSDQSVDKHFMMTHFGCDENTRVKGEITSSGPPSGGVWEYYGEDSTSYYGLYDMKSDYGWSQLIGFLDTLNNHNEYIDKLLNIDSHLWFLALSNLMVNLDGPINNPQNYYLYKDSNGRFNPMPWDFNESFGGYTNHQTLGNLGTTQLQQLSPFANIYEDEFPVISKIFNNADYRKIYVAHMKTILQEYFSSDLYETRALELQEIIDEDVQADQNKFYTYNNFVSNVYNQVGGGPNTVIGIVQLMEARANFISNLTEFQKVAPEISNVTHMPELVSPQTEVWFNAEVTNESNVILAYRNNTYDIFEKVNMYDDGNHEDGQAGDGIYGVSLIAGSSDIQYYIFAENTDAVSFSPARAEYEFYSIGITGDLVINEFMADNETTVMDQDGEYDDWIEFYNNSSNEISLNGYYLSDDATEPDQWMFPDTTIAPNGYLIVWADKDEEQEGLHADLKLSASGESIILSDNDLNIIDYVDFPEQKPDTTTGRYENGTGDFIEMLPTFGYENSNIVYIIDESISLNSEVSLKQNYPNPFSNTTTIEFTLPENSDVELRIFNTLGVLVNTMVSGELAQGRHIYEWDASDQGGGVYFYSLTVNGVSEVKKMLRQ